MENKKEKKAKDDKERAHSNGLWCIDYTMHYDTVSPLRVIDDHSRFIVEFNLMKTSNVKDTLAAY